MLNFSYIYSFPFDMKKPFKILVIGFIACLFFACNSKKDTVQNAVYVWGDRSEYSYFSDEESKVIFDNEIKKVYCKLSDVVWDEAIHAKPEDIKSLPLRELIAKYSDVVPCIFFTNEVMLKSSKEELDYMAEKIAFRINKYEVKELQLDCDWSEKSKDNYFHFIKKVREDLDSTKSISATIRLYQYKYPEKTGVPPVDRGMLMLYNFNSPKEFREENLIYEEAEALKYTSNKAYDLPLDFAIASYNWSIWYNKEKEFKSYLTQEVADKLFKDTKTTKDSMVFTFTKDVTLENDFYREGDIIHYSKMDSTKIQSTYNLIEKFKNTDKYTVSLFEMNAQTLKYLNQDENIFKTQRP